MAGFFLELVPTVLIGAGFPLIAYLALERPDREGRTVGGVYFANTLGNLAGGVATGFVMLALLGTELLLLIFASIQMAFLLFAGRFAGRVFPLRSRAIVALSAIAAGSVLFPKQGELYELMYPEALPEVQRYFEEGRDGVIMTYKKDEEVLNFINGLGHGVRPSWTFAVQALEAIRLAPRADDVLIIGFGLGTHTELALASDAVQSVTLVELNRTLMANLAKIDLFRRMLESDKLDVVYDDGRRYLLQTDRRFDIVMMDPLRTTTAYSNNIYSREFFELVGSSLKPGGIFLVWMDEPVVVARTLATVFREVRYYLLPESQYFCLASNGAFGRAKRRREVAPLAVLQPEIGRIAATVLDDLEPALDREELLRLSAGQAINRDWRPISEYYLGLQSSPERGPTR